MGGGNLPLGDFPRAWPAAQRDLSPPEKLACAARIMGRAGFTLDVAGHISVMDDETGHMWVNPYGIWWEELRASQVLLVDLDGKVVRGDLDVSPAVSMHCEIHRARPEAKVVVHNHPYYGTLLATMHTLPRITDQQAAMLHGEIVLYSDYEGATTDAAGGRSLVQAISGRTVAVMANEGVAVLAPTIEEATYKAVTFERTCKLHVDAMKAGGHPVELPQRAIDKMKDILVIYSTRFYWDGMIRQLLAEEPDVLQ